MATRTLGIETLINVNVWYIGTQSTFSEIAPQMSVYIGGNIDARKAAVTRIGQL